MKPATSLTAKLKRFEHLLPWISLFWGIAETIFIGREYTHAARFLAYTAGAFTLLFTFSVWFEWVAKNSEPSGSDPQRVPGFFARNRKAWEWIGVTSVQMCVQFILLYMVPLLFVAHRWLFLTITVVLAISTLWDPWWVRLVVIRPYRRILTAWAAICSASFMYGLFFAGRLEFFQFVVCTVIILSCLPSRGFKKLALGEKVFDVLFFTAAIALAVLQWTTPSHERIPPFSIWLRNPQLGFGMLNKDVAVPLENNFDTEMLVAKIRAGETICCQTPVVGPRGIAQHITHQWRVNGRIVDEIVLPEITGSATTAGAYRTHSCKANWGDPTKIETLSCFAYIEPNIFLGKIEIHRR